MSAFEFFFVQITDRLYKNFTGPLGAYVFKDGRSVVKLHRNDAVQLSHGFACDAVDDDGNVMFKVIPGQMPTTAEMQMGKRSAPVEIKPDLTATEGNLEQADEAKAPSVKYTVAELEAIADKQGLRGLREEANKHGIKGKSIPELIKKLMEV